MKYKEFIVHPAAIEAGLTSKEEIIKRVSLIGKDVEFQSQGIKYVSRESNKEIFDTYESIITRLEMSPEEHLRRLFPDFDGPIVIMTFTEKDVNLHGPPPGTGMFGSNVQGKA